MKKYLLGLSLLAGSLLLTGCGGPDAGGEAKAYGPTEAVEGYAPFSDAALATALEAGDDVVLFFGATRCPPCIALHKDIQANIANIPENLTILTSDFDLATELKEKYGVTKKHTAIYLGADGSIKKVNTSKEHKLEDIINGIGDEVE